ncbi:hypothetical protein Emed_003452 [Eimeria media]
MSPRPASIGGLAAAGCCLLLLYLVTVGAKSDGRLADGLRERHGDTSGVLDSWKSSASTNGDCLEGSSTAPGGSGICRAKLQDQQQPSKGLFGPGRVYDPLARGLELTREADPQGLRMGPGRPSEEFDQEAMLQLLRQRTAIVNTGVYSVHVHTRETRELEAFLKGQEYVEDKQERQVPSLVQTFGERKGRRTRAVSVVSSTTSGAQVYLDELCTLGRQEEGGSSAASVARFLDSTQDMYCLRSNEVSLSASGLGCTDGCGKRLMCYGMPKPELQARLESDAEFARARKLSFNLTALREEYCVRSHVQKKLDGLCVKGYLARWSDPNWRCYSVEEELDFTVQGRTCSDECGYIDSCYGQPKFDQLGTIIPRWKARFYEFTKAFCPCDERMGRKEGYRGCQTQTRLGKTCQSWASQSPHKHNMLTTEEHNFCRNPGGEPYIWCFTTDPAVRFDICDPVGLTRQYLQPESEFSLEYQSVGATPYKAIRFFDGSKESAECGSTDLVLAGGVTLPLTDAGTYKETPEVVVEEGDTQKLVWSGFQLLPKQRTDLLVCICDFEFVFASSNPNGSCSSASDFNIMGGFLKIAAAAAKCLSLTAAADCLSVTAPATYRRISVSLRLGSTVSLGPLAVSSSKLPTYKTSVPFTRELEGLKLSKGDRIDIGFNVRGSSCLLRSLGRTFSVAKTFGSHGNISAKLAAAWMNRAFKLETTTSFESIGNVEGQYDSAVVGPLSVSRIGQYVMCWTGEGTDGRAVGLITKFETTGFDFTDEQVAPYALSSTGANENLFSLIVRYAGPELDLSSLVFTLREPSATPCGGKEVASSLSVTRIASSTDSSVMLRGSGMLLRQGASVEEGSLLNLCIDTSEGRVFTGYATVRGFGLCSSWQISLDGTPTSVPLATHGVRLTAYGPLGLHWLEGAPKSFLEGWGEALFTEGEFLKTLTFAVFEEGLILYAWTTEDVAPRQVAAVEVSGWSALTTDITFERCIFYAVTKEGNANVVSKFDARDPTLLPSASPLTKSAATPAQDLCCLTTIYEASETKEGPIVLALDTRSGKLLWFDEELQLVEERANWQGLSFPLQYPCSLSCTLKSSGSKETEETADTAGTVDDSEEGKARGARAGDVYDCFIADRDAHRLVQVEVDTGKRGSALIHEYVALGTGGDRLNRPVNVVAYKYSSETMIFVLQEGRQALDLLVHNSDGTTDYYNTMQRQSVGLGIPALPFMAEVGDSSGGFGGARIVVYRTTGDKVTLQILSFEATAVAASFTYSHSDWYTVGDEVALEPVVAGSASLSLFKRFHLSPNVPDFSVVSRIASVDSSKGTLKLSLSPVLEPSVEIRVVGQGVVDEVTAGLTINVACKSGHYMKDGMCAKCPVGSFNNLTLVRQSPADRWGACKACKKLTSTVSEGSTSEEQCICTKGYYLDEAGDEPQCVPCPPAVVAVCFAAGIRHVERHVPCKFVLYCCGGHHVGGEEVCLSIARFVEKLGGPVVCASFAVSLSHPGFIYDASADSCIRAPQGTFSVGGYLATSVECPLNTTTKPEYTGLLTSLRDCFCDAGFEPAKPSRLADPTTAEYQFRAWLRSIPDYSGIDDSQICVPCGPLRYKETVSDEACLSCPTASYASGYAPKSKKDCNLCKAGFYETANVDIPCGQCPEGSYCVGSEPRLPSLLHFAGQKKSCPENSDTVGNSVENDHPFKCTCLPGYAAESVDEDTGTFVCQAVKPGFFKDTQSNSGPVECPLGGKSEASGADSLQLCICSAGEYRDMDTWTCTNMTTSGVGAVSSSDCVCGAGAYRLYSGAAEETGVCEPCPINTYKEETGNAACRACAVNSGTEETGATSAAQCLCKGGYYYDDKLKQCTACRESYKYCPGGSIPCTDEDPSCVGGSMPAPPVECPEHTRITAGFDTPSSVSDCLCDRGFAYRGEDAAGNKVCEPCPSGSYKSSVQDANCNGLCGSHSTSLPGMQYQNQCYCESGTYYAAGGCHVCPEGATCLGGLTEAAMQMLANDATVTDITSADHIKPFPQPGYFLEKLQEELEEPNDWHFIKCPVESSCLGNGECSATMTDYLCSECRENYTNTFNKGEICTRCPSVGVNVALCTAYYIGVLLFNIGMAYMNVAAGFNRRSIHSIVIKIASNFITCMSVLFVVDYEQIQLPSWFHSLRSNVSEQISSSEKTHFMAVDCVLRDKLDLSYGDSFFYTMLFYAFLPIILPVVATLIMFLFVREAKRYFRHSTQRKLGVLQQTIRFNLTSLTEQLRDKLEEDRLFLMFRYIPLPGETVWRRLYKFFEDMIPIYVTVLFFIYTSTTRNMLSLLDCTAIEFGDEYGSSYHLTAAMSVKCEFSVQSEYFKFALLGFLGLLLWSIGIPLWAFLVLFVKRKNLNSKETRLKYGFLHNGFVRKYWYWETVVFARKFSILVISSVVLLPTNDESAARIMITSAIAIAFNILHLRCQPFDKRGETNIVLIACIVLPVLSFALEVLVSLAFAYFDNVRATRTFFTVPVIGRVFRFLAYLSERRKAREPVVMLDEDDQSIQLVAAKRSGRVSRFFRVRNKSINFDERSYFLKVMAEALGFAVVHLKLDVIPGYFLEFALRLGLVFAKLEEDTQNNKASLRALAGGDMSKLMDWTKQEEEKQQQRQRLVRAQSALAVGLHSFYSEWERKIEEEAAGEESEECSSDEEEKRERVRDLEGGESDLEEDSGSESSEGSQQDIDARLLDLERLVSRMTAEEQAETVYLFDEEVVSCGIALSELYLSLLKLQLKSPAAIEDQFNAFREKKVLVQEERAAKLRLKNKKLRIIRDAVSCAINDPDSSLAQSLPTQADNERMQQQLQQLNQKLTFLKEKLEALKTNPDEWEPSDKEDSLEWIDDKGEKKREEEGSEESPLLSQPKKKKRDSAAGTELEDEFKHTLASSESDLSDQETSIEKPPKKFLNKPFKILNANAEDWMEE